MELNYNEYLKLNANDKLSYFMSSLSSTNRTPEYYVNWDKTIRNTKNYELELNTLNYLIGKDNIVELATNLFNQQPELLKAVPILIAHRDMSFDVLELLEDKADFYHLNFDIIDTYNINKYIKFCEECGLLNFLKNEANRSLVDYVYGVEVGLDSNARKNRSGSIMEMLVEKNTKKICEEIEFQYMIQASPKNLKKVWNIDVPVDKSSRKFDVAVFDPFKRKLFLIETNYYGGGGSKLKSVAGEFTTLNNFLLSNSENISFLWITDGQGWKTAHIPLLEAFGKIDNIFNIEMLSKNFLKSCFLK
ncbi:type II restriction enzyme [Peptoniphilus olsenii]|uniref:Type-2 restriction enzyme n=1 Tax=Peptoniphilus olsenii TaxID=411570 RepID=A0ABV2JAI8_9FIRM